MDQTTFRHQVEYALAHLRDVVHLRTLALGTVLLPAVPHSQRGWELLRCLLEALQRLRPGPGCEDEWSRRRYELLTLRCVNGLSPDEVAERLAISSRHFYRQLPRALDDFADLLWDEVADRAPSDLPAEPPGAAGEAQDVLCQELAAFRQSPQRSSLPEVWRSVLGVLSPLLKARPVALQADLDASLPDVAASGEVLKQFILGLMGNLLQAGGDRITLQARASGQGLELAVSGAGEGGAWSEAAERLPGRLSIVQGASPLACDVQTDGICYRLALPAAAARTVLVVEDNPEMCLLLQRYLKSGGYRPLVASTGAEAIAQARTQPLHAVTLDLMMENEDGWDVLQALRDSPETVEVPVIVCTVLNHRDLAVMLGAKAFLKKPVMREQLLQALAEVTRNQRS